MMQPAVVGGDAHPGSRPCRHEKLPGELGGCFLERLKGGRAEGMNPHQDSAGGAQIQIGEIGFRQPGAEFHAAEHRPPAQPQRLQLLRAECFKARSRDGEEIVRFADHVAFDAFIEILNHGGVRFNYRWVRFARKIAGAIASCSGLT